MTILTPVEAASALPGWHAGSNLLHIPLTNVNDHSESLWHAIVLPSDRPRIVCLCGSTRFREEFAAVNRDLTNQGVIVVAPGVFGHSGDPMTEEEKTRLDDLHRQKIVLADEVLVVSDETGYYGDSTRSEIAYARQVGKPVRFTSQQSGEASR